MSRELAPLMAECLEEACFLWFKRPAGEDIVPPASYGHLFDSDKQPLATIAVALYQERMRRQQPLPLEPAIYGSGGLDVRGRPPEGAGGDAQNPPVDFHAVNWEVPRQRVGTWTARGNSPIIEQGSSLGDENSPLPHGSDETLS